MKIKQSDIYNFWVDYIEVLGTLNKLNEINFWIWEHEGNKYTLFPGFKLRRDDRVTNYAYKIIFTYKEVDCYAYHVWQENWAITTVDYMAVYGTAFTLFPELSEIVHFIESEMSISKLRRFDLATDVLFNIKDIHKGFRQLNQKWSIFFDEQWKVQTFYIWEKKKANNRYKLIRVYNKKDDILVKKRQKLFPDYLKQKDVTRVEVEIRAELAKTCTLNSLLDRSYMFDLFLTYISLHTKMFSWFKYEVTRLNQVNKKVSIEDLKVDEYLRERYVSIFIWYGKAIIEMWGCPVDILLRKWHLSDDTTKDIALSIRNWEFRQDVYEFGLNIRSARDIFSNDDEDEILF